MACPDIFVNGVADMEGHIVLSQVHHGILSILDTGVSFSSGSPLHAMVQYRLAGHSAALRASNLGRPIAAAKLLALVKLSRSTAHSGKS